jgi:hypothetical protein
MPVSRNRKKKHSQKSPLKNKEVFRDGPMEIVRKGKNIFMRNNMTEEEHQQYRQQVKEGRPKAYEDIKELIQKVKDKIDEFDKLTVLSAIASLCLFKINTDPSDDGISETVLEYLQSVVLADVENVNSEKMPDPKSLTFIYENLKEIRHQFSYYFMSESLVERYPPIEAKVRHDMISEALFIRGDGYLKHINILYDELFTPHDAVLKQKYGFTSSDIRKAFEHIEYALSFRIMMPNGFPHPTQSFIYREWMEKNKPSLERIKSGEYLNDFAIDHPEIIVQDNQVVLYRMNDINLSKELFRIRFLNNEIEEKVVKALSLKLGDNDVFKKYI